MAADPAETVRQLEADLAAVRASIDESRELIERSRGVVAVGANDVAPDAAPPVRATPPRPPDEPSAIFAAE